MKLSIVLLAGMLAVPAQAIAQTSPVPVFGASTKLFSSSADVQAAIAEAKSLHTSDKKPTLVPIFAIGPYVMNVEYRTGQTPPTIHTGLSELMYVLEGRATLHQGGKLIGGKGPPELTAGTVIEGKTTGTVIQKGDFIVMPPNTPHQFSPDKTPFIIVSVHIPTPVVETKTAQQR